MSKTSNLKEYKVIFTKDYTTVSAANRVVKQYEEKHGVQDTVSNRKRFLVEKIEAGKYTLTFFNMRKKLA